MNCPKCRSKLEFISGQYDTGVVAPDGYRESAWQEGYYCKRCDQIYELSDIEPVGDWRERRKARLGF